MSESTSDRSTARTRAARALRDARFVEALIADLHPVRPIASLPAAVAGWCAATVGLVALGLAATGSLRPGVATDLASLRFAAECALGVFAAGALAAAGLELPVPGSAHSRRLIAVGLASTTLWAMWLLAGPWLAEAGRLGGPLPSMLGKRAHCFVEGLTLSAIGLGLALIALRGRAIAPGSGGGALVGGAAGALTGTAMQLACMYDPGHALRFHVTPILLIAALGAAIAPRVRPRH